MQEADAGRRICVPRWTWNRRAAAEGQRRLGRVSMIQSILVFLFLFGCRMVGHVHFLLHISWFTSILM